MFYRERAFQETAIGKIPKDWGFTELGNSSIAEIFLGQSPPSSTYNDQGEGLLFLQGKMEFGDIYPSPTSFCSEPAKIAEPNDILLSVRAPVGAVNIAQDRYCIGRGLSAIRPRKGKLSHLFLFYYLCSTEKRFSSISMGSTFKAIRKDEIERFSIPLPQLQEQEVISDVLSCVDLTIQKTDEVIAKTERLKKGLMQQLLTRGIGHTEYTDTPIGRTPKTWQTTPLKDVVRSYKNGIYKPNQYSGRGYPCIRMYNIAGGHINLINAALLDVTEQELKEFGLESGDVVVNRVNTSELVGKAGVVPVGFGKATFESKNIRVRLDDGKLSPAFFSVFVQTRTYSNQLLAQAKTAVAQATITQDDLDSVVIPLPPSIDEQQRIAEIISTVDKKLVLEKEKKTRLEKIKRCLMDLLLTGKIRVKVD